MPLGATDPCKVGVMGSTPMRSTDDERAHGPTGRHRHGMAVIRVRFPVSPLLELNSRKIAGYGLPGRSAKPRDPSLWSFGFDSHVFRCRRLRPDGETEIIPRFYRGVPGSNPGRAAVYGVRGVGVAACLAVNQEVRVRLPSDTPVNVK